MARVTDTEVREIIELDEELNTTPFINTANRLVTKVCVDSSLTEDDLKDIELWLSAHFCAISDMRAASEKASTVAISYQYKVDLGLNVTIYGQQAMIADTSGALAQLNKNKGKSKIEFVGGDYSSELD